jgi:drug/metabolite transporter (DMT)-like permease
MNVKALCAAAMTVALWSSSFAGIRAGLEGYGPGHLALLRHLVAAGALALVALATGARLMPRRCDLPRIALVGLLGVTAYQLAVNYGERTVPAGVASLIFSSGPLFIALLGTGVLGEHLTRWGWLGSAVGFAGIALTTFAGGEVGRVESNALIILAGVVGSSIAAVTKKSLLARYPPFELTAYGLWVGTCGLLPFAPGLSDAVRAAPDQATLAACYLGLFSSALATLTWAYALSRAPVSVVSNALYAVSPLAILVAWLWLGEIPSPISLVGGGVALVGVALVQLKG